MPGNAPRQCTAAAAVRAPCGIAAGRPAAWSVRPPPAIRPPAARRPPCLPAGKRRAGYEPRRCFECRTRPRCGLHQADDESSSTTDFPVPGEGGTSSHSRGCHASLFLFTGRLSARHSRSSFRQSEGNHGVRIVSSEEASRGREAAACRPNSGRERQSTPVVCPVVDGPCPEYISRIQTCDACTRARGRSARQTARKCARSLISENGRRSRVRAPCSPAGHARVRHVDMYRQFGKSRRQSLRRRLAAPQLEFVTSDSSAPSPSPSRRACSHESLRPWPLLQFSYAAG